MHAFVAPPQPRVPVGWWSEVTKDTSRMCPPVRLLRLVQEPGTPAARALAVGATVFLASYAT